nr:hypothetical protein [Tanacetum cinerariifolium]
NGLIGVQGNGNQNQIRNGNLVAVRAEGNVAGHNGNQLRCYNCRGVGHFARDCTVAQNPRVQNVGNQNGLMGIQRNGNLVAVRAEGNAAGHNGNQIRCCNCRGQASSSRTQTDSTLVYDSNGSAEVHEYQNCYNNEIFNMFTQEK